MHGNYIANNITNILHVKFTANKEIKDIKLIHLKKKCKVAIIMKHIIQCDYG